MSKYSDTVLYYVHDPMCSWCWGFNSTRQTLFKNLPDNIEIKWLLGGLAPDSDQPMPEEMRTYLQNTWRKIQQRIPGTKFNFDFWEKCKPRRSTYPACRAVIAAREQGSEFNLLMIQAIQKAYYTHASNPSDNNTLIALADKIGLDIARFEKDLLAESTQQKLLSEIKQCKKLGVENFPALILIAGNRKWRVPVDYNNSQVMLDVITDMLD
ncbi:MAG TPA: DsbA family protein [Chromatiales bacterium]|nr:DsbA family protein [Thiotrichales bacterium]HIP69102.1 DsbA family protein [Chromatiales bacterium]